MESKPIRNVSLSYACEKNWNEMEEVAGGRFCASCQHVVHDFSNQSDCQLKKILQQNSRVCGRFKRSQMSAEFLKYAAATVIAAASGVTINSCTDEGINPAFPIENIPKVELDETELSDTTEFYTTGIVFIDPKELQETETPDKEELDSEKE